MVHNAFYGKFRLSMICFMIMAGLLGILAGCNGGSDGSDDDNNSPTATIDAIAPNPADTGQVVTFTGHGSDSKGLITGYRWSSSISGDLSADAFFSKADLPVGEHTISFHVQDEDGTWSDPVSQILTVQAFIPNNPPTAEIDEITPNPADAGQVVIFNGHGSDEDGFVTGYRWSSSISGDLSADAFFPKADLPVGEHTISFHVQDEDGTWSDPVSQILTVQAFIPNNPPTAEIDDITPNPADAGQVVTFNGLGSDEDGLIAGYKWSSSICGTLSLNSNFSSKSLPVGIHTISLLVQDDEGVWSVAATQSLTVNPVNSSVEHIYICLAYGSTENHKNDLETLLQDIGANPVPGEFSKYTDPQGKDFVIHLVENLNDMRQALMTSGAHVIFNGHSNFGLGAVFTTKYATDSNVIDDIYTIDDPRIFNYSSPWISVKINRIRTHQAYPNWWPVFQDGTSGIMPYDYDDPAGDPPYNYFITYQIPGDPTYTHHLLQSENIGSIQRFPDSHCPAWYSADGSKPDPSNPDHLRYFITNPEPWSPSLQVTGEWFLSTRLAGFFKENYFYRPHGSGMHGIKYLFTVPEAGQYRVFSWWPESDFNTSVARYVVNHAGGNSIQWVDQKKGGGRWNEIGDYSFLAGDYSVMISDQAHSGIVVADGIRVVARDNPPAVIQADFTAETRYWPAAPLYVTFESTSTGDVSSYEWDFGDGSWDFGDGSKDTNRTFVSHRYNSPGTYTVRLTVDGQTGTNTKVKTDYIIVGSDAAPLRAEFSGDEQQGSIPHETEFSDMSSGQIVAWSWDFNDDGFIDSTDQNPNHTYLESGNYTVSLTVTDTDGQSATERKTNFVLVRLFDKYLDNIDYPKNHFRNKTILFRKDLEVPKAELKYSRLFYDSCNSGSYYLDTFNHGIVFYTVNDSLGLGLTIYLKNYLLGKSDYEIWEQMQKREAVYDYYDFNKLPSQQ